MLGTSHKIVASSRKSLHNCHVVSETLIIPSEFPLCQIIDQRKGGRPHDDKIQNHGHEDAKHRSEVVQDVVTLVGEHDEDGIEQPHEGEG